eukprot:COSAG01_NODE_3489_length_6015_cov_4.244422_2_plen_334_part_00
MVDDEVDDIPDDFVFIVGGAPILVSHRSALSALHTLAPPPHASPGEDGLRRAAIYAPQDESEEAGHTVGECLPTLTLQDRSLATEAPAPADDGFGDFGAPAPAPPQSMMAGDDFGDFSAPAPAPAVADDGFGDFGDFGSVPAPATAADADDGFGDFGDFGAPAPAAASSAAGADDGFGDFGDVTAAPAPPPPGDDDGFGDFGAAAATPAPAPPSSAAAADFGSFDAPSSPVVDDGAAAAAADAVAQAEAAAAAEKEAEAKAAAAKAAEEEAEAARQLAKEQEMAAISSRHSAVLSSRAERVAETLKIEKERVPPPRHQCAGRNSELAEIYLRC